MFQEFQIGDTGNKEVGRKSGRDESRQVWRASRESRHGNDIGAGPVVISTDGIFLGGIEFEK